MQVSLFGFSELLTRKISSRTTIGSSMAACCALLILAGLVGCGGSSPTSTSNQTPPPVNPQTLRGAAQTHSLLIGAAAESNLLSESLYASTLSSEYSQLEPETEMKFDLIHPNPGTYDYIGPDQLVAFALAHSMKIRGHTLVWHSQLPGWIVSPAIPWIPTTLSQVLSDHIANVMGHYKGQVYAWDVVNEPFNDNGTMRSSVWYDSPGIGFAGQGTKTIEQALRWAHAADPAAKLFVNEYGAETTGAKSDAVYAMAQDFVARGVPLHGVGLQLHVDPNFDSASSMTALSQNIQRLGALGLDVHLTEIDVRLPDNTTASLSAQAQTYQDLAKVCLSQPACKVFQTWGFSDKYSWIPEYFPGYGWALPLDENYAKKPAYNQLLKALQ